MKRSIPALWLGTTMLAFLVGYAIGPSRSAAIQNAAGAAPAAAQSNPPAGALPPETIRG